jgi:hypothetical protein
VSSHGELRLTEQWGRINKIEKVKSGTQCNGSWLCVERQRLISQKTEESTSVMCPSVDPLITVVEHTAQSTEYEHVCVVVDQVVHS